MCESPRQSVLDSQGSAGLVSSPILGQVASIQCTRFNTYQWTSRPRAPGVYSRIHVRYAGTTLGLPTRTAEVLLHTRPVDRETQAAAPARTYSHSWLGTCRGREVQRGPIWDGTGRRRRLRRAEPVRAKRSGKMTLLTVMTYSPVGRLRRFTSSLYKGRTVNLESLLLRFQTHATMNT